MNAVVRIGLVTAIVLSGCAPTQQWLEVRVCEYEAKKAEARNSCEADKREIAGAVADHQVEFARRRAENDGNEAAERLAESDDEEDQNAEALYRDQEELAEQPINPMAGDSVVELDGEKAREEFEERHDVEPPEQGRVFRGHFESSEETTLAVHRPGEALELYSDGRRVSSLDLGDYTDERPPEDVMGFPPGALELVRDGTQELQVVHTESDGDETVYHLNIYKFIGSRIGTIFSEPVAVRGADGSLRRLVRPRYLQGLDHRIIEWTPLDENEEPAGEAERYKWNEWEGVYRIPSRPPTAPRSMVDDAMDG